MNDLCSMDGSHRDCNLGKISPQTCSSLGVWVSICVLLISWAALSEKQYIGNAKSVKTNLSLKVKCSFFFLSNEWERDK